MTTFDPADVRAFAANLNARMDQCDDGESAEFADLDATLRQYAAACCEFCKRCREWGRAIFSGGVAFNPEVERIWLREGFRMQARASELWEHCRAGSGESFVLEDGAALGSALRWLERLLFEWVTPKLAIAPLARQGVGVSSGGAIDVQRRVDALPPLPADWQPTDPRQGILVRMLRKR